MGGGKPRPYIPHPPRPAEAPAASKFAAPAGRGVGQFNWTFRS